MVRKMNRPRFLLSSYILGAVAAFSSAALLDYLYFDQAVHAHETAIRRSHRDVLKRHDDYLHARLCDETRKARELATADAAAEVTSISENLKSALKVAEARQKLLDIKNRQLKELASSASMRVESQSENSGVNGQLKELQSSASMQASRGFRSSLQFSPAAARRQFGIGVQDFFDRRYATALKSFEAAHQGDPKNALYVYFIGLAQLRSGERELAMTTVTKAVAMETVRPIYDWGTRMERVPGPHRTWLENVRTSAGLGRHAR